MLQIGQVIGFIVVCIVLARLAMLISPSHSSNGGGCDEVAIEYETKTVYSYKIPEGEEFEAQEGVDGLLRICHSPFEVGEVYDEVVEEPIDHVTVSGYGELPPEAHAIHSDIDYVLSWNADLNDVERDFTEEAYTHYCESIEPYDYYDYVEDWEEYCADR